MDQPVVPFEFLSKDPGKAVGLLREDLRLEDQTHARAELPHRETGAEAGINGGIVKPDRPEPWPGNTTVYVAVDDLAAYRKRILAAGGKMLIEEQEVPGMGSFSLFADPEGRMMGLWRHAG
jgi:predicted enzyme related to lactoylglutathione lyase